MKTQLLGRAAERLALTYLKNAGTDEDREKFLLQSWRNRSHYAAEESNTAQPDYIY